MKIGHPANKPPATPAAGTPAPAADVAKTTPSPKHATDFAAPADAERDGRALEHRLDAAVERLDARFRRRQGRPDQRRDRAGTFKVDHAAIADKLISNAQELLGKVKG